MCLSLTIAWLLSVHAHTNRIISFISITCVCCMDFETFSRVEIDEVYDVFEGIRYTYLTV